jgi:hypothetical protein
VNSRKHHRENPELFDENDAPSTQVNGGNRIKRATYETPGSVSVNMVARSATGAPSDADIEETEHNIRLRQLKTAAWFGKTPMSRQEEAEKGTKVALRKMLTSFGSRLDADISTQVLAETDVKTVMSRFPPLQDRDTEQTKDAFYFNSFFHSSKSKNPEIKELAGALHAVLVGQDIQRVSYILLLSWGLRVCTNYFFYRCIPRRFWTIFVNMILE